MNLKTKSSSILLLLFSLFTIHYSLFTREAFAVCPLCTIAVGTGLGLSRWFGIDDSVSGIWVGGLIISLSFWLADWLSKKNLKILKKLGHRTLVIVSTVFWSLLTFLPLWKTGIIGHPFNTILGIDKLLFGSILGAGAFLIGTFVDKEVRQIKKGQLFSFQKIVFPLVSLVFSSLVVYFYGGRLL